MQVRLDVCVSAVAAEAGLDPDRVGQDKINILRFINDVRREIASLPVHLQALEHIGELLGAVHVTAGTVAATQNQAEVTGTTTSFATAMAGRYMKIGDVDYRRISYVTDTTHLTLETGWPGDTVSAKTYRIWKKYYPLPPKVSKINNIKDYTNTVPFTYYDPSEFILKFKDESETGTPHSYTVYGASDYGLDYLGSTVFAGVSVTANSPIVASLAGAVTALAPGDKLRIGDTTTASAFYIDRILTDTQVSLRTVVPQTGGSLSATSLSTNRKLLQFFPTIDGTPVFMYTAMLDIFDLFDDEALLEDGWYTAIKKGAIAKSLGYIRDQRETQKIQEYQMELQNLVRNQLKALNPFPRLKPWISKRYS